MVERVRVGAVLALQRRPVDVSIDRTYEEIGIRSFGRGVFHKEPVPGASLGSKRVFRIEPGDLLLSNVFAWEGAIAVARDAERGKIGSHRFMTYTPVDSERIDTNWASWFFRSEPGLELIRRASPGSAGRNRTLAIERFEALEIPLPPIQDQRRVSAALDRIVVAAEGAIQLTDEANEIAGALGVSIASRPDLTREAKLSAGWTRTPLGEVLAPASDSIRVDAAVTYPNIGIYSFGRGVFEKPDIDGSSTSASTLFRVHAGQFIYSRLFAFEGAYARVPSRFDGYFVSNEFPAFDPDVSRLDTHWLATVLRSPSRWAELGGASKGIGVRRQRVPVEAVLRYAIWLPPLEIQQSAVRALERLDETSRSRSASVERLNALTPAAVNEAFAAVS
jgi:type I restriction enzyme S subunit